MTGVDSRINPRLGFKGNVGAGFIEVAGTNTNLVPIGTESPLLGGQSGSAVGLLWDIVLTYRVDPTTRASLTAGQSVSPDIAGNYSKRRSVGISVGRDINHSSSINFAASFTNLTSVSSTYDFVTASVFYNYRLTKEWTSALSYTFRERASEVDRASSNSVMLVVKHEATVLPSKSATPP
jgi:hypothetical protein